MGSSFDRWKKDPFFHVAEEVQESADRMESTYRTWIHATKDTSNMWNPDELRRDLLTTLGTAKWQLEEFEREVRWSYSKSSSDNARNRHQDFITAIKDKIRKIEDSLNESNPIGSKESKPWVCLDEGEKDELALFLSGMPEDEGENEEMSLSLSRGHRRAASADIGYCKILVSDDHVDHSNPMHKVSSLSGFLSSMETISKWKFNVLDHHHKQTHFAISPNVRFNKGNNTTLDSSDECYDKQHYGWCGTVQRQLQRSQYQMQYTGFVRVTVLIVFLLCLIGLIAFRTK